MYCFILINYVHFNVLCNTFDCVGRMKGINDKVKIKYNGMNSGVVLLNLTYYFGL